MTDNIKAVCIGGSAGSYSVVKMILASIPVCFPIPVFLCLHRLKGVNSGLVESLNRYSKLKVIEPLDKTPVKPGYVYLSPANYHMLIEPTAIIALSTESDVNYSRPSIDITFMTAGFVYREKMMGILLSGTNSDGAKGLYQAYGYGAYTITQDPGSAQFRTMPEEVMKYFTPHKILKDTEIVEIINSLKCRINV